MAINTTQLHGDYFTPCDGTVEIVETDEGGAGKVTFLSTGACLAFGGKAKFPHLPWVIQRKCADGAFIQISGGDVHLHIVELKSKLTRTEWAKVKRQFEGMLINALAVAGVGDIKAFSEVKFYIAFKEEYISQKNTTAPIMLKKKLGTTEFLDEESDFEKGEISVYSLTNAPLVKLVRAASGDAELTL